jgi:hypothetical protein
MFENPTGTAAAIAGAVLGTVALYYMLKWMFVVVVAEDDFAILERLGKFERVLGQGINWKVPFVDRKRGKVSRRLQQTHVRVEATTKDGVTVTVVAAVRHRNSENHSMIYKAFYGLLRPTEHLDTLIKNNVSGYVGEMNFGDVVSASAGIATRLKEALRAEADTNGYILHDVVVTNIEANALVRDAGNRSEAARREEATQTALAKAETARKDASADAVLAMLAKLKAQNIEGDQAVALVAAMLAGEAVQVAAQSDNTAIVVPAGTGAAEAALARMANRAAGRTFR